MKLHWCLWIRRKKCYKTFLVMYPKYVLNANFNSSHTQKCEQDLTFLQFSPLLNREKTKKLEPFPRFFFHIRGELPVWSHTASWWSSIESKNRAGGKENAARLATHVLKGGENRDKRLKSEYRDSGSCVYNVIRNVSESCLHVLLRWQQSQECWLWL